MSSTSIPPGKGRLPAASESSCTPNSRDSEFARHERAHCESEASHPSTSTDNIISADNRAGDADKVEMVITSIRAADVTLGLRRVPAGFYTAVRHSGYEWRTENKRSSVNLDLVEWTGPIPIPSDQSATVDFKVFASFEFQPMFGAGEQLRKLTVTVKQLLYRSARDSPFTFFPKEQDVVSPCSSILVSVGRQMPQMSTVLLSCRSLLESPAKLLEDITNQGHSALSRYRKRGERRDLELSIEKFEMAHSICPVDHPCRAAAESNLAMATFVLCQVDGAAASLKIPLELNLDALQMRPIGHTDRASTLIRLATVSFARYDMSKDEIEGEVFEALLQEVLKISSGETYENQAARFMLQLRAACSINPPSLRYQLDGESSVERNLRSWISSLALLERHAEFGELEDLEQAIVITKNLAWTTSVWDDDYPGVLCQLGLALLDRFRQLGELGDLENAISTLKDAVQLTPDGHPKKCSCLSNLGGALQCRYERHGELRDLEHAILTHREAVVVARGLNKPGCLSNLGNSLCARFERLGEPDNLDEAITIHKEAVQFTPHGDPDRPCHLNNLSISLCNRFMHHGELRDLDDAVVTLREVVQLTPNGHPDRPGRLSNLGASLHTRFERHGEFRDLDDAILTHRNAIQLTPDGHPNKPSYLNNLSIALLSRFERLGELRDLDDTISIHRGTVQLIPEDHPEKPDHLSNLGSSLLTRFQHNGELRDLYDAVSTHREAVQLVPDSHSNKFAYLMNLGSSLSTLFEWHGEPHDLEDAISTHRAAVQLIPDCHPSKPSCLNNLGSSLCSRFQHIGELDDLDEAIATQRGAVQLTPDGHPDKPTRLSNLGIFLRERFSRLRELHDLEDAILTHRAAVQLTPHGHPDKPTRLINLGSSHLTRFELLRELHDVEGALSVYSHAAFSPLGPIRSRFRASLKWIFCARLVRHHTLLHAYSVSINLLPQLAWIGLSLEHRYAELTQGSGVVREAAAAALDAGLPELAVEWLERGRSVVWGAQFQLRGSYEELASAHPDHARRLQNLSTALNNASATREKSLAALSPGARGVADRGKPESLRQEAGRHRALAIARDNLLREIRKLPGFDGFLRYKRFSQLRASAHAGPVVILNAAENRCDALVVLANVDHVVHVPLPKFTLQRSADLQNILKNLIRREGQSIKLEAAGWETLLPALWKSVAKPVLDALALSIPGDLSRIFWCPTGPFVFLPLHAAGLYDAQYSQLGHKVFEFVVSSYTPSLAILAQSLDHTAVRSDNLHFLAVSQPTTDGQRHLPGVATELAHIREAVKNLHSAHITLAEPCIGTVKEVLFLMKDADWVHFACHGVQDGIDSGLCLADGRRLRVRDMITVSRPHGGLAFLSACQTAKGDKLLSDEAIHIAAGMLFAGYAGVIGTMWSISDPLAPGVARDVYGHLFGKGTRPDSREAAFALHEAIGRLRDKVGASFDEWIPFIHVGL